MTNVIKEYFKDIETYDELGVCWYRAMDVSKVLKISSIRGLIQNYGDTEKEVRETARETGNQMTIYISTGGLYRLLYNIKGELGIKFRTEVKVILDEKYFGGIDLDFLD